MRSFLLTLLLLLSTTAVAQKTEYHVNKKADNLVKFISDAPVEDFEGVTDNIDGYLTYSGDSWPDGSELYFEVDLRTLDTGIGLRNRHMREDYLHTEKYPYAKFRGRIGKATPSGKDITVQVNGEMHIHGKKKKMNVSGTLTPSGNAVRIQTKFEVNLEDHDIEVPKFMFLKISEIMQMVLDFHLTKVAG
ncbi:MAG: YceI family protein [Bacteroidetes bacterium]|nr:YceI family protein [Bacteroidota bacterium]